jgi:membrane protease YdiL (CAAX protease family)
MPAEPSAALDNSHQSQPSAPSRPIASRAHLAGFILIMAGIATLGFLSQHAASSAPNGAGAHQLAGHSKAIRIYLVAILMDWALFYYCWVGAHHAGNKLTVLSGERWSSWRSVAVDLAIAIPFWLLWEGVAHAARWMLGASSAKTVDSLLPQSLTEVLLWILVCLTAGFCEEIAFRGYLQKQLQSLGGGIVLAVIAQGIIFGSAHAYQGWHAVIVISVLGILYGALAAWRKNLRINIATHAFGDFWEGWLKFVIWR